MGPLVPSQKSALKISLLVMGFSAVAFQIVIIRELLVIFHGNELSVGIILGNWLILEAAGSFYFRKKADITETYIRSFSLLQILLGFCSIFSIIFIRSFKYIFHIPVGEVLGIHYVMLVSFIALAPVTIIDGALFPYGCRNLSSISQKQEASARVYLYQASGSFIAGIVFVFYLIHRLNSIELTTVILFLNLCSVILYLNSVRDTWIIKKAAFGFLIVTVATFAFHGQKWLNLASAKILWYEYLLIESRNSEYANIAVIKSNDQHTFFVNGAPYATTPSPEMEVEELAHFPMLFHRDPHDILVIGGGAGGLLRELLKYPDVNITYAEHDPLIIKTFNDFPTALTVYEMNHEKVKTYSAEGRLFLRNTTHNYDLILVNLPIPLTLQLNRFYTKEFFELAGKHLRKNGIFSLKMPGSETFLSRDFTELNRMVYQTLKTVFPHVRVLIGGQNIFISSADEATETIGDEALTKRLNKRGIRADLMREGYIHYKTDRSRFGQLENEIISAGTKKINQDVNPRGVFESMVFLNLMTSPFMGRTFDMIGNVPFFYYPIFIIISVLILTIIQHMRKSDIFITFAITSTGFVSMLLNILLIFLFQIYYGHVYHYIGLLTSVCMLGLACGSYFAMKRPGTGLVSIEGQLVFLFVVVYIFVMSKVESTLLSQSFIFGIMFYLGILTGMEYPVAVRLSDSSFRKVSATAGRLYALDLVGAFFGAILPAVVFIPIMGIQHTLILVIILKTGSLLLACMGTYRTK